MDWLITGGAGFIGSHLTERLLRKGDRVVAIDDLSTGSVANLTTFRNHPKYKFVADTVMNVSALRELVDAADVVVHLAAAVGVRLIVESPVRTIETNVGATELVLDAAAKKRKRVIIASTSEVYGKGNKFPFNEADDLLLGCPTKGRWSYAASKLIDEFLALAYWKEKKLPATVVRLFNTVGPRQTGRYGMVVPTFVRQALSGVPLSVYGTGEQSRCFGHVYDVIWGLEKLSRSEATVGEIYNIGSQDEVSILGLAKQHHPSSPARVRRSSSSPTTRPYEAELRGHGPPDPGHRQGVASHRLQGHAAPGRHPAGRHRLRAGPSPGRRPRRAREPCGDSGRGVNEGRRHGEAVDFLPPRLRNAGRRGVPEVASPTSRSFNDLGEPLPCPSPCSASLRERGGNDRVREQIDSLTGARRRWNCLDHPSSITSSVSLAVRSQENVAAWRIPRSRKPWRSRSSANTCTSFSAMSAGLLGSK